MEKVDDLTKRDLINKLCYVFAEFDVPIQVAQQKLTMILHDYDVTIAEKALVVYTEGKNVGYIQRFLISKKVAGCTKRTIGMYSEYLNRILPKFSKDADVITPDDLMMYFAIRMQDGLSDCAIDNERRVLSSFFSFLQRDGLIVRNPIFQLGKMKSRKNPKKAFTEIEVEKMRSELRSSQERAIFELLLSTGCRVSEIISIKIDDIKDNSVRILGKGEKWRTVYLNAKSCLAVAKYLEDRSDNNPYLFPRCRGAVGHGEMIKLKKDEMVEWYKNAELVDPDDHCTAEKIENLVRTVGKRACVQEVHPHKFRRTCATFALQKGMPVMLVSKMLGHENVATTQIYLDLNDDDLREAHRKYV